MRQSNNGRQDLSLLTIECIEGGVQATSIFIASTF